MGIDGPKIFISHAWQDKPFVHRLEADLKAAGVKVWVDHSKTHGGDNLPERISEALEWSNTLLLIWSESAARSQWVKLEWTNAVSLGKVIIPCILGKTKIPTILANKIYIDFRNYELGMANLLRALQPVDRKQPGTLINSIANQIRALYHQLIKPSRWASVTLILGLVSIFLSNHLPILPALATIVFGRITRAKIKKNPSNTSGKKRTLIGLSLGYISLIIGIAELILTNATK